MLHCFASNDLVVGEMLEFVFQEHQLALRSWGNFEDSRTMKYENGDKCWNGPDRSFKVKFLRCDLKNKLTDVDEPSHCDDLYIALLSTPSLCLESKLKELQQKLELVQQTVPQGHDEL